MPLVTSGLHLVTAIARDPRENVAFYVGVLGLHLFKRTVNLDDQASYHLYNGDPGGRPGTLLTFFIQPSRQAGAPSSSARVTCVRFAVPSGSLGYWAARLTRHDVTFTVDDSSCERQALTLSDPDELQIQLVEAPGTGLFVSPYDPPLQAEASIRGLHGVVLSIVNPQPTCAFLTGAMALLEIEPGPDRRRFAAVGNGPGRFVDVLAEPNVLAVPVPCGRVHHAAFRARDSRKQLAWQQRLRAGGLDVTDVKDRKYFRSIYFHEPARVRFELATDAPGFSIDESPGALGERLQLPASLEAEREGWEAGLGALPL